VDPDSFDADHTFHFDANPDPIVITVVRQTRIFRPWCSVSYLFTCRIVQIFLILPGFIQAKMSSDNFFPSPQSLIQNCIKIGTVPIRKRSSHIFLPYFATFAFFKPYLSAIFPLNFYLSFLSYFP
jgi:hypothetical protein